MHGIGKEEALALLKPERRNELRERAHEITERCVEKRFDFCSIINSRCGRCSENCKWCAQSAHWKTGCETYGWVGTEAEMKHGPIALVDEEMPVVFIATHHQLYQKIISNMQEVISRGGHIIAVVTEGDEQVKSMVDEVIEIPETLGCLAPLLSVIPLQLLSYHVAVAKGLNVDQPRNLAKSVTVE